MTMTRYNPALGDISEDNKIRALLAAYQKNAAELLAIEASQEKLISLVLGIYSAGLTLLAALLKDAKSKSLMQSSEHQPSLFSWALIVVAILIGLYAVYMSTRRNHARRAVRGGLRRVDEALGFFQQGNYLANQQLYEDSWLAYSMPGFLDWAHAIVVAAGIAFISAIYFIATS
jgi:hypothetical protein